MGEALASQVEQMVEELRKEDEELALTPPEGQEVTPPPPLASIPPPAGETETDTPAACKIRTPRAHSHSRIFCARHA